MLIKEGTILELIKGLDDEMEFLDLSGVTTKIVTVAEIKENNKNDTQIYSLWENKFNYGKVKKLSIRIDRCGVYNQV